MKRLFLLALAFSFLFINCNKDDDDNPIKFEASWLADIGEDEIDALWLFYTDETGQIVEAKEGQAGQQINLSTEGTRLDLTTLKRARRLFLEEDVVVEREIFELRTYLDVPVDFTIEKPQKAVAATRAFAIESVSALDKLIWPENSTTTFIFPIFQNTTENILSFEVPLNLGQAAYLTIKANGESIPRYIWIDEVLEQDYTFNYTSLPVLQDQLEVSLPNDAFWIYNVYGVNSLGTTTRLAAPTLPALETERFVLSLPSDADVAELRVQAFDLINTSKGQTYSQNFIDKIVSSMPAAIPSIGNSMMVVRNEDMFELSLNDEEVNAVELSTRLLTSADEVKLDWEIYGYPDAFIQFRWPNWPGILSADRIDLIKLVNESEIFFTAKKYDSQALYRDYLNAQAQGDALWEAQQGLERSTRLVE